MNPRRPTPRHITTKVPKVNDKERIHKVAKKKKTKKKNYLLYTREPP